MSSLIDALGLYKALSLINKMVADSIKVIFTHSPQSSRNSRLVRRVNVELWSLPWWILGLYSLTALFTLLFSLSLASYRVFERGLLHGSDAILASAYIDSTPLGCTPLEGAGLSSHSKASRRRGEGLSPWVTRIFIAIVLQCAAIYLISAYPGTESPFWLGIVLQGFTYGSAAVCYASWGWEPHDD